MGQIAHLCVVGGGGDEPDLLAVGGQHIKEFFGQGVGKLLQIASHELAGLVGLGQIVAVVVPIERGVSGLLQRLEELLLHVVQHVEPHEDIMLPLGNGQLMMPRILGHAAIDGTGVSQPVGLQLLVQALVDLCHHVPDLQEMAAEGGLTLYLQRRKKLLQGPALLLGQELVVVQFR